MIFLRYYFSLLLSFGLSYSYCQPQKNAVVIAGEFATGIQADEMILLYWDDVISESSMQFTVHKSLVVPVKNGKFLFEVHPRNPLIYLKIGWENDNYGNLRDQNQYLYVAETGDQIALKIDSTSSGYRLSFYGQGAVKYNSIYNLSMRLTSLRNEWLNRNEQNYDPDYRSWRINRGNDLKEHLVQMQLAMLDKYRTNLPNHIYQIHKANVISHIYQLNSSGLYNLLAAPPSGVPIDSVKFYVNKALVWLEEKITHLEAATNKEMLLVSANYTDLQLSVSKVQARLKDVPVLDVLLQIEPMAIRERAIASYLLTHSTTLDSHSKDSLFRHAVTILTDSVCIGALNNYIKDSGAGALAYNFSLPDAYGNQVSLSDFKGKVVFIDFWYVGCGGCADYYQRVVKNVKEYYKDDNEVVFIAVSIDKDRQKWLNGVKSGLYTSEEVVNLHCPDGLQNPIINQFAVKYYPRPLLLDRSSKVVSDSTKELRDNGADGLINMIEKVKERE